MMSPDFNSLRGWLGLTNQQYDVLQIIWSLQSVGKNPSPKIIQESFFSKYGVKIQKPNLFNILKFLIEKGFLKKTGKGVYNLDKAGISRSIKAKKEFFLTSVSECEKAIVDLDSLLEKIIENEKKPIINYLDHVDMWHAVSKVLEYSNNYYLTAKFPGIAYTYNPYSKIGRGDYLKLLWDKALIKGGIHVRYISALDLDYPMTHSMTLYGDYDRSVEETKIILKQLQNQVENYENLSIFYLDNPYGLDVILPFKDCPENSFLFVRDNENNVVGTIHIKNRDIALKARQTFVNICSQAKLLDSSNVRPVIKRKLKELKGYGKK